MSNHEVERAEQPSATEERATWTPLSGALVLDCANGTRCWRLVHSHYTICVLHRGRADWEYRREHFSVAPGSVYVCEPGEVHTTRRVYCPGDFTVFFLDPALVAASADAFERRPEPHFDARGVARRDLWSRFGAFQQMLAESQTEALEQELSRLLSSLLHETQPKVQESPTPSGVFEAARALLERRFRDDPTEVVRLRPIADELGVSYHRLVHGFSRRYAIAPYEFVSLLRAQHALSELRLGPRLECRTLAAVAQNCGYADSAHMVRAFRRHWGLPPQKIARDINPAWAQERTSRRTTPRR